MPIIFFVVIFVVAVLCGFYFLRLSVYGEYDADKKDMYLEFFGDVTDRTTVEADSVIFRCEGNYKRIESTITFVSHFNGSVDIYIQPDIPYDCKDKSYQLFIGTLIIPDEYEVDVSNSIDTYAWECNGDSLLAYHDEGENVLGLDSFTVRPKEGINFEDIKTAYMFLVEGYTIPHDYSPAMKEYISEQTDLLDNLFDKGLEHTIKTKYEKNYDLNNDGVVSIVDASILLRFLTEVGD
jgi:hypothetical protein